MISEQWRPVNVEGGIYAEWHDVSDRGRVRSWSKSVGREAKLPRMKTLTLLNTGYLQVGLNCRSRERKKFSVHRLVAFAFPEVCGEWSEGMQVNHKNGDKCDNRAGNLEWVSAKGNMSHAGEEGLRSHRWLSDDEWFAVMAEVYRNPTLTHEAIAKRMGLHRMSVSKILNGENRPRILDHFLREAQITREYYSWRISGDERAYQVFALRDAGESFDRIAVETGISKSTCRRMFVGIMRPHLRRKWIAEKILAENRRMAA